MTELANNAPKLTIHVIYNSPSDFPGTWVVREWTTERDGRAVPGGARLADNLLLARALVPPHCVCLQPMEGDDPTIVETWI